MINFMIIPIPGPYNSNTYYHANQHTKLHIFFRTILLKKNIFQLHDLYYIIVLVFSNIR